MGLCWAFVSVRSVASINAPKSEIVALVKPVKAWGIRALWQTDEGDSLVKESSRHKTVSHGASSRDPKENLKWVQVRHSIFENKGNTDIRSFPLSTAVGLSYCVTLSDHSLNHCVVSIEVARWLRDHVRPLHDNTSQIYKVKALMEARWSVKPGIIPASRDEEKRDQC